MSGKLLFSKHLEKEEHERRGYESFDYNYSQHTRNRVQSQGAPAVRNRWGGDTQLVPANNFRRGKQAASNHREEDELAKFRRQPRDEDPDSDLGENESSVNYRIANHKSRGRRARW